MKIINFLTLAFLVLIINKFFSVGSFWHQEGQYNVADIGLLFTGIAISYLYFIKKHKLYNKIFLILVITYLFMVVLQILLAKINFNQSYLNGLIASRMQFYYLSYILIVFCLEDVSDIKRFLDFMTYLAVIAFILGIINFFIPGIISHYQDDRTIYRFEVARIFLPAMPLISFAAIYEISKLSINKEKKNLFFTLVLIAAHLVRMTRMRIIGVFSIIILSILLQKRIILGIVLCFIFVLSSSIINLVLPENVITKPFESSYEELTQSSGTWGERVGQSEFALQEFLKNPFFGNGAASLRNAIYQNDKYLAALSYYADLGYLAFMKSYGLIGVAWLIVLFLSIHRCLTKITINDNNMTIVVFCRNYFIFILGTSITLNHFMYEQGILLICIIMGCLDRLASISKESELNEN